MKARAALFIPLEDFLQVWRRVLILELRPDGSLAEGENENLVSDLFFFFSEAPNLNLRCGVTSPLSPQTLLVAKFFGVSPSRSVRERRLRSAYLKVWSQIRTNLKLPLATPHHHPPPHPVKLTAHGSAPSLQSTRNYHSGCSAWSSLCGKITKRRNTREGEILSFEAGRHCVKRKKINFWCFFLFFFRQVSPG